MTFPTQHTQWIYYTQNPIHTLYKILPLYITLSRKKTVINDFIHIQAHQELLHYEYAIHWHCIHYTQGIYQNVLYIMWFFAAVLCLVRQGTYLHDLTLWHYNYMPLSIVENLTMAVIILMSTSVPVLYCPHYSWLSPTYWQTNKTECSCFGVLLLTTDMLFHLICTFIGMAVVDL